MDGPGLAGWSYAIGCDWRSEPTARITQDVGAHIPTSERLSWPWGGTDGEEGWHSEPTVCLVVLLCDDLANTATCSGVRLLNDLLLEWRELLFGGPSLEVSPGLGVLCE